MNDISNITTVINQYFQGTYRGDTTMLRQAFHSDARITGSFQGTICDWSLEDFINRVTASPTASESQSVYDKEIILLDITGHCAMVKARVVVGSLVFTDYITLLKIGERWVIRNKSFTT